MKEHYTNPMIHKAYDLLKTLSADDETRIQAETREKALITEAILMSGERKKGREEGIKEVARKMLAKAMSPSEIAELTGLDIKEVEKLKSDTLHQSHDPQGI